MQVDSYEEFEFAMYRAKNAAVDMQMYSDYLAKHYTSIRVEELKKILESL